MPKRLPALLSAAALLVAGAVVAPAGAPAAGAVVAPSAGAADAPQWWNRGNIPLYSTTAVGGETAVMPDGSVRTYLAVSGKPGYLAEVDPFTGKVLRMLDLYVPNPDSTEDPKDTGAQGAWGVSVDKRGTVFVSSYGFGHVYRLPWRATALEDLGRPSPRTSFTWEGDTDEHGNFFIGTSEFFGPAPLPGGRLFGWSAQTRKYRDYGDFGATYGYVRSVEYAHGKIYAGLGQNVGLWQVDPTSGKRREIKPPAGMPTDKYAYQLEDEGGYLYVLFAGGTTASEGWVLDLKTLKWRDKIGGYAGQTLSSAGHGDVYLVADGELKRYDPKRKRLTGTGFRGGAEQEDLGGLGAAKAMGRVRDPRTHHEVVLGGSSLGQLWRYDTVTRTGTMIQLDGLKGTQTAPRSLAAGPDGKIYAGGYFQGGLAVYDPATTTWADYPFHHQIEGMAAHNGKLYFGVYPNAQLWEYDPAQPYGENNPKFLFDLKTDGQERPWTVTSAGPYLAIGTSPKNSQDNGGVTLYDPATGTHRTWTTGLVTGSNQISALTYRDGILYGGSLGCCNFDSTKSPGQVFALDAASGSLLWTTTPLPAEQGVGGLTFDGSGRLFGMTYGTAFELDPASGQLKRSKEYFAYDWTKVTNFQPRAVNLAWDPGDGKIYATNGNTRRIDPDTLTDLGPNYKTSFAALPLQASKFYVQGTVLLEVKWY